MARRRLLHLTGSAETELMAELSVLYATGCLDALGDDEWEHVVAYVRPGGSWCFPVDLTSAAIAAAETCTAASALARLANLDVALALPQMFCRSGMTTYRALLDLIGVPFVGNPAAVMAVGADKAWTRAIASQAGVAVPDAEVLRRGEGPTLALPVVVKPVDADNSSGVSLVRRPEEYDAALAEAFTHSDRVLVERYVELGREVRCGVIETDDGLRCLPLEEYAVDATTKPIRDHADKLIRQPSGRLALVAKDAEHAWIVPTPDPLDPVTDAVWRAARTAHRALGCRDYSLFDFRIDPAGTPFLLEAGLYCSFAPSSVLVTMARAAGLSLTDWFEACARRASRR